MNGQDHAQFRILLFEDNGLLRSILARLLLAQGWEVFSFPDPEACPLHYSAGCCACQGLEACADAIITDLTMHGLDGLSFVEELRQKGCKVKHFAMLTDSQDRVLLAQARAAGFTVFSKGDGVKPVLDWLRGIQSQLASERQLVRWTDL